MSVVALIPAADNNDIFAKLNEIITNINDLMHENAKNIKTRTD